MSEKESDMLENLLERQQTNREPDQPGTHAKIMSSASMRLPFRKEGGVNKDFLVTGLDRQPKEQG